jgi:uncharacterized membrane protein YciS (DUF1049 family)
MPEITIPISLLVSLIFFLGLLIGFITGGLLTASGQMNKEREERIRK